MLAPSGKRVTLVEARRIGCGVSHRSTVHGSRFGVDGAVLDGPATRALAKRNVRPARHESGTIDADPSSEADREFGGIGVTPQVKPAKPGSGQLVDSDAQMVIAWAPGAGATDVAGAAPALAPLSTNTVSAVRCSGDGVCCPVLVLAWRPAAIPVTTKKPVTC